ncbi:unnamed protein product [Mycena citricolor]|uniref:Uncharacterized protein n=1 Tax=Mycena citricolor TaxID=2018698 RepID=A0AAD2GT42_9AGAR|nr:unnamed protein product [Mycena citricolor]
MKLGASCVPGNWSSLLQPSRRRACLSVQIDSPLAPPKQGASQIPARLITSVMGSHGSIRPDLPCPTAEHRSRTPADVRSSTLQGVSSPQASVTHAHPFQRATFHCSCVRSF